MQLIMQLDREVTPLVNGFLTLTVANADQAEEVIKKFIQFGLWVDDAYYPPSSLITARREP